MLSINYKMDLIRKDPSFKSNHKYLIGKRFDKVFGFKVISFFRQANLFT